MELLFLGTGAAEGNPSAYCGCEGCAEVRRAARGRPSSRVSSRDCRTRSSLRLGESAQIDFGPDGFSQLLREGKDLRGLEHLLITHGHADHFDLGEIVSKGMARDANPAPLELCVSPGLASWLERNMGVLLEWLDVSDREKGEWREAFPLRVMTPYLAHQVGELEVEPVEAAHGTLRGGEVALSYRIRLPGGSSLLYACDTGWYGDRTWEYLRDRRVDVLVMECTFGGRTDRDERPWGHLDCRSHALMLDRMAGIGLVDGRTRLYATHLNPHQGLSHGELQEWFDSRGIAVTVAYDGLALEV